MKKSLRFAIASAILSLGLVCSALVVSKFFIRIRHEQTISVKGYAEMDMRSDVGKVGCRLSTRSETLAAAHADLKSQRERIENALVALGFDSADISRSSVSSYKINRRNEQGNVTNDIEYYELSQSMSLTSPDVDRVAQVPTALDELMGEGIELWVYEPEFFLSELHDAKLELLGKATEDGYKRAETLANGSGGSVGELVSARQGVFQITGPSSTETSAGGTYDTSTIDKTVKAVVTLEYAVNAG